MTQDLIDKGIEIFQIHKLARADAEHCSLLLRFLHPKNKAVVLDAGCGIGTVSKYMKAIRPDLDFILCNQSRAQLDKCPDEFRRMRYDFCKLPLSSGSLDGIMYNYSLGHAAIGDAFKEASRLLRPGGVILVYDLQGERTKFIHELEYWVHSAGHMKKVASAHSLRTHMVINPDTTTEQFDSVIPESQRKVLAGLKPVIYRMIKQ